MSAPLISVSDLEKTYVTRGRALVPALAGISLDIHAGEFVTIVGQSGCGKTTPLKILAGLIPGSAGSASGTRPILAAPRRPAPNAMTAGSPAAMCRRAIAGGTLREPGLRAPAGMS